MSTETWKLFMKCLSEKKVIVQLRVINLVSDQDDVVIV